MTAQPKTERFYSIDTLRGFAVLGILIMNIQAFAMVFEAYAWPPAHMDLTGANLDVWAYSHIFASMKAMTTFSALFGAGIVLMLGDEKGTPTGIHFRRMIWLLLIGLIHAWVFWAGDILVPYAVFGMIVVAARRMSVRGLIILGSVLVGIAGIMMMGLMMLIPMMPEAELQAALAPTPEMVAETVATYQQGFMARLPDNMMLALNSEIAQLTFFGMRIAGAMLFGMALFKSGFLTLRWAVGKYLITAAIALAISLPPIWWSTFRWSDAGFPLDQMWVTETINYFGSLFTALGYASIIMLVCKLKLFNWLLYPFTAAGRMAFTNYLTHTLVMTFIFVGPPGLGRFGTMERVEQIQLVAIVLIAQLIISPIWLHFFRFGPMEWAWRSLTYWRFQPMGKG